MDTRRGVAPRCKRRMPGWGVLRSGEHHSPGRSPILCAARVTFPAVTDTHKPSGVRLPNGHFWCPAPAEAFAFLRDGEKHAVPQPRAGAVASAGRHNRKASEMTRPRASIRGCQRPPRRWRLLPVARRPADSVANTDSSAKPVSRAVMRARDCPLGRRHAAKPSPASRSSASVAPAATPSTA